MIVIKSILYGYAFLFLLALITWLFQGKLDLGEEEIQEDEIENVRKDGKWD